MSKFVDPVRLVSDNGVGNDDLGRRAAAKGAAGRQRTKARVTQGREYKERNNHGAR